MGGLTCLFEFEFRPTNHRHAYTLRYANMIGVCDDMQLFHRPAWLHAIVDARLFGSISCPNLLCVELEWQEAINRIMRAAERERERELEEREGDRDRACVA